MEDKREAELERLTKKLKEQQDLLEALTDEQERLQKKSDEAGKIADPAQREAALKKLAGEQAALKKHAQDIQNELRKLSRLRAEKANELVDQAIQNMEKSLQRLQRGQLPEQNPDDVLDRLDEASAQLQRAQRDAEEELAREQLARVADTIRQLRDREQGLAEEGDRIKLLAEREGWSRPQLLSLGSLGENQRDLGRETGRLAERNLADARVVARLLENVARDMNGAADEFELQRKGNDNND